MLMFGAIFQEARSNLIYLIFLSLLLGQLADCSLLTYIYEMNNSERLFGIVSCHLLVTGVSVYSVFFNRTTAEFWWLIFSLSLVACIMCFFEKKDTEWKISITEVFQNKLYVPLILACIGGLVAVCSSMIIMEELAPIVPNSRFLFYGGAAIGSVIYYIIYRFSPKPATVSLVTSFAFAVGAIFCFVLKIIQHGPLISAFFAGATFNMCMMNLYYILCNIIRKYRDSHMLKTAPIVSNFAGIAITVIATMVFFYSDDKSIEIGMLLCMAGNVIILATSGLWDKGISTTAKQEEYMHFDTSITIEQAYESVGLTDKEIEVAELLLEGCKLIEIANKLCISENTAKTHRTSIYKKMQVSSRDELISKLKNTVREK
jgi:DNA-binding CsgD family transcriptional regulator